SGLSTALIQRQDITHTDECTVFWFNLGVGALVSLLLAPCAPIIAWPFSLRFLIPLTLLMPLNVFLTRLGPIHSTLLTKRLDFRTQMKVTGLATLISGGVAIYMAWKGWGVWALAAQAVASSAASTLFLWIFDPWRPALVFSKASARRLLGFGGYL